MEIREAIKAINQLQVDGIIFNYAIGGAVGATFYLEPVSTLDVDVFVSFKPETGSRIVSPQPIFDYFKARGCAMEGEYIVIAGWPVQILPRPARWWRKHLDRRLPETLVAEWRAFSPPNTRRHRASTGRAKDKSRLLRVC